MHKKGRGVVLAGRVRECCGGSQQLGWVEFPKPQTAQKKRKRRTVQDSNLRRQTPGDGTVRDTRDFYTWEVFRRIMYSSTAA